MPLVTETVIDALAHCADQRCAGYTQQPVKAERESFLLRFEDIADTQCPDCGEPRIVADQTRPIYPNVSGQPQDALLRGTRDAERVRELELADARREAEMAQMRATMERLAAANDRLMDRLETPRTRARKDEPQA
jgi:hypothetical protein